MEFFLFFQFATVAMALSMPFHLNTTAVRNVTRCGRFLVRGDHIISTDHLNSTGHNTTTPRLVVIDQQSVPTNKTSPCGKDVISTVTAKQVEQAQELHRRASPPPSLEEEEEEEEEEERFFHITHFHYHCHQPPRLTILSFWQFRCWWTFDIAVRTWNTPQNTNKVHCTNHGYDLSDRHKRSSYAERRKHHQTVRYYPCQAVDPQHQMRAAEEGNNNNNNNKTSFSRVSAYITDPRSRRAALWESDELRVQYEIVKKKQMEGGKEVVVVRRKEVYRAAVKVKGFTPKQLREFHVRLEKVEWARPVAPPANRWEA